MQHDITLLSSARTLNIVEMWEGKNKADVSGSYKGTGGGGGGLGREGGVEGERRDTDVGKGSLSEKKKEERGQKSIL